MLGINTVYLDVSQIEQMGFDRIETCPSPIRDKNLRRDKMLREIEFCNANSIPFSIHLPVYLFDWFDAHSLDAFFLDKDNEKSDMSMKLLSENLNRLSAVGVDYVVTHFAGVYRQNIRTSRTDELLYRRLNEIQELANKNGINVCLEYMGGNGAFYHPEHWLEAIDNLPDVDILVDTGHLYFSCEIYGMDFDTQFKMLLPYARAFHFWNIFGRGAYDESNAYRQFHHIAPRLEQKRSEGWAFDAKRLFEQMHSTGKPIIIEATQRYNGVEYFERGIREFLALNLELDKK